MALATDFTVDELICVCIARQIEDGGVVAQGIATLLVMTGYLLAKHSWEILAAEGCLTGMWMQMFGRNAHAGRVESPGVVF